jgi:hypothetical protein
MSHQHANRSPDIIRLRNEGYEVSIRGAHLLISHVPYVNASCTVQYGTLVSTLTFQGDQLAKPDTHVVHFIGDHPCFKDGSLMAPIRHGSQTTQLAEGIVVNHSFSNKPPDGYPDYHAKMTRYIEVISAETRSLDETVRATTFVVVGDGSDDDIFLYPDTNSSRAEIEAISSKLKGLKIAIIGLGGTGSYVLDLVAKTAVAEIHLHDGDVFVQHNAFRSPGAPTVEQLRSPPLKVDYLAQIYSRMRRGITAHKAFLTAGNVSDLSLMDFVFICVDDGAAKQVAIEYLELRDKPFIDVGMGVQTCDSQLLGIVRSTLSTSGQREHVRKHVAFNDGPDDDYGTNIQIADLNMLNAAFAVIKWKKLFGFYHDLNQEHHSTYSINVNQLVDS